MQVSINIEPSSIPESRNDKWSTRFGDVRRKIFKMTRSRDNISFVYKELFRTMRACFQDVGVFDGESNFREVKVLTGSAERTIAKLKQENNLILPVISVTQTISQNDESRNRYESLLVHDKVFDLETRRAKRVLSLAPRAVNIMYEVSIWTKYMSDMDQILEQIRLKFNPEMEVPTSFGTITKASLGDEQMIGSIEAPDKEDRILKKKLDVIIKTYIPNPKFLVTNTGEIIELNVEGTESINKNL